MIDSTRIAIRLEGREPLRGVVESSLGDTPQPFVGWLGLLKVLEAAVGHGAASQEEIRVSQPRGNPS